MFSAASRVKSNTESAPWTGPILTQFWLKLNSCLFTFLSNWRKFIKPVEFEKKTKNNDRSANILHYYQKVLQIDAESSGCSRIIIQVRKIVKMADEWWRILTYVSLAHRFWGKFDSMFIKNPTSFSFLRTTYLVGCV